MGEQEQDREELFDFQIPKLTLGCGIQGTRIAPWSFSRKPPTPPPPHSLAQRRDAKALKTLETPARKGRPCVSSLRRAVSAGEEDVPGCVVPDEEQEGVVCIKRLSDHGRAHGDDGSGGGGGLRPLFVDVHESLVNHLGEDQVVPGRHACEWVRVG